MTTLPSDSDVFDVFVSYSSKDADVANDLCEFLEASGLRCWIAPRNIVAGREYGENISDAIPRCKCLCLVFSSNSNESPHVASEVALAFDSRVNILPVRIEDVKMNEDMGYRLNRFHQVSAPGGNIRAHLPDLPNQIRLLMGGRGKGAFANRRTGRSIALLSVMAAIAISLAVSMFLAPEASIEPELSIFEQQSETQKVLVDEQYSTLKADANLWLQPSEHEGYHRYTLEILSNGDAKLYAEEDQLKADDGPLRNLWSFGPDGAPGPWTVILLVTRSAMTEKEQHELIKRITRIGKRPNMGDAGQILWGRRNWRSIESKKSRGPKEVSYDPTWANDLLRVLNSEEDLWFSGRTIVTEQ